MGDLEDEELKAALEEEEIYQSHAEYCRRLIVERNLAERAIRKRRPRRSWRSSCTRLRPITLAELARPPP